MGPWHREPRLCTIVRDAGGSSAREATSFADDQEAGPSPEDRAVNWIRRAERIVAVCGAGISTSAGIPDFRTPGTGLYARLSAKGMEDPMSVFSLDLFYENPDPFLELSREFLPRPRSEGGFVPTPCHFFLRLLDEAGKLRRVYTQNIDGLERIAGLSPDALVECHGTYHTASCPRCGTPYAGDMRAVLQKADTWPHCHKCGSLAKPDVVLFGEGLPPRFHECLAQDFEQGPLPDLVLVVGTSLEVAPVSQIPDFVPASTPRVLVNMELAGSFAVRDVAPPKAKRRRGKHKEKGASKGKQKQEDEGPIYVTKYGRMRLPGSRRLEAAELEGRVEDLARLHEMRARWDNDAVLLGDSDATSWALATRLGWESRLRELIEQR